MLPTWALIVVATSVSHTLVEDAVVVDVGIEADLDPVASRVRAPVIGAVTVQVAENLRRDGDGLEAADVLGHY